MGTSMAPPYADLFLGKFENEKILTTNFSQYINLYKRFLDDIFMLWTGTLQELDNFIKHINAIHPTIKFTHQYSKTEIDFLDTTIYVDELSATFKSQRTKTPYYISRHTIHRIQKRA